MAKLDERSKDFQELRKEWFEFSPQTEEELFAFIHKMTTEYEHDYGTVVHAIVALMKAVFNYAEKKEGLTGFQVSVMKWIALGEIFGVKDDLGLKLIAYCDVFYPQYLDRMSLVEIDHNMHERLITIAKSLLEEHKDANKKVYKHWKKLAKGWLPKFFVVKERNS